MTERWPRKNRWPRSWATPQPRSDRGGGIHPLLSSRIRLPPGQERRVSWTWTRAAAGDSPVPSRACQSRPRPARAAPRGRRWQGLCVGAAVLAPVRGSGAQNRRWWQVGLQQRTLAGSGMDSGAVFRPPPPPVSAHTSWQGRMRYALVDQPLHLPPPVWGSGSARAAGPHHHADDRRVHIPS